VKVVSVINYKGGVGKTTLTANIGAGVAARGRKVLLIDLDPQASLTFSFFSQVEWRESLANTRTIKQWYDSSGRGRTATHLADLIVTPPRVSSLLAGSGWLDLIASHQDLVAVDALLAGVLDGKSGEVPASRFVQVHRRLADGLADKRLDDYDLVLIDCPPNFNMMTKNAVVASDFLLVPARPDYLSTTGIDHLGVQVHRLVQDYNGHLRGTRGRQRDAPPLARPATAVVFTMVQYWGNEPLDALGKYISRVQALRVPTFSTFVRDRKAVYADAPEYGIPAILLGSARHDAGQELRQVVDEFINWVERIPG
jgi:chromosome partitioning protein